MLTREMMVEKLKQHIIDKENLKVKEQHMGNMEIDNLFATICYQEEKLNGMSNVEIWEYYKKVFPLMTEEK